MSAIKNIFSKLFFAATIVLITGNSLTAQDKVKPKLRLSCIKYMDGTYEIKAKAYAKKDGEFEPCADAQIGFYTDADEEKLFRKTKTDAMGETVLQLSAQNASAFKDSTGQYHFYAVVEKDDKYKSAEADVSVMDADIDVNFKQESDTVKVLQASIMCYDAKTKKMMPGEKIPLKFGVKRALCILPVGKDLNYTDTGGHAEVAFPNDIPGDKDGNLTVIVKLDDDDNYGTVQFNKVVKWGVPLLHPDDPLASRSIIGSRNNAPWFLVISISAILIAIWGYLCYIIYGLFQIKKHEKTRTSIM